MLLTLVSFTLFMCRINCFSSTLVNGAQLIFKKLISRLLSRPISFFESTPSGEIIQRCLSDTNSIDFIIPQKINSLLNSLFLLISGYLIMIYQNPINFIIIAISMSYSSIIIYKFSKVSNLLMSMQDNSINPVISAVNELVSGANSIRAYQKVNYLKTKLVLKIKTHLAASFY